MIFSQDVKSTPIRMRNKHEKSSILREILERGSSEATADWTTSDLDGERCVCTKTVAMEENLLTPSDPDENGEMERANQEEGRKNRASRTSISNSIHNITQLLGIKFWEEANWFDVVCEVLFHIKRRNTTIEHEVYAGIVQFISCMYVLPVIPEQMVNAGYDPDSSYSVTVHEYLTNPATQ
jgi:hypothetical protein